MPYSLDDFLVCKFAEEERLSHTSTHICNTSMCPHFFKPIIVKILHSFCRCRKNSVSRVSYLAVSVCLPSFPTISPICVCLSPWHTIAFSSHAYNQIETDKMNLEVEIISSLHQRQFPHLLMHNTACYITTLLRLNGGPSFYVRSM